MDLGSARLPQIDVDPAPPYQVKRICSLALTPEELAGRQFDRLHDGGQVVQFIRRQLGNSGTCCRKATVIVEPSPITACRRADSHACQACGRAPR
jgi:hypothetical protein